jgi:hypothetical protein
LTKDNKQNFWDLGSSEDESVSLVKGSGVSQSNTPIGEAIDDTMSDTALNVSSETGLAVSGFAHLDQVLSDLSSGVPRVTAC